MLEEEDEASYPDSGPVIDSREGGLDELVSELEDGVGSTGGGAVGKLLPRHLGQEAGCHSGGSTPCGQEPGFLLHVLTGSKLQGLLLVLGTVSHLPMGCGCPHPGGYSFVVTILVSHAKVSALPHPGVGKVFTHSLFHLCLSSSNISISPLTLPL